MPKVQVVADDGEVMFVERVQAADFAADHFKENFAERIGWAAEDAQVHDSRFEREAAADAD